MTVYKLDFKSFRFNSLVNVKGGVQFRAIWTKKIFFRNTCWNSDFLISFYMRNTKAKWQKLFDLYNTAFGRAMMREGVRFEVTSWKVGSKVGSSRKFKKIFLTSDPLGVILCEESIARTPEPWKCFLDLIQGRNRCIKAKIKHFRIFMRKPSILRFF